MIIVAGDERNYNLIMDALQAKLLVEVLTELVRQPNFVPVMVKASEAVNQDGFETIGTDSIAATNSVMSVLGYWTRQLKRNLPEVTSEVAPPETTVETEGAEENKEATPKPLVN